MTNRNTRVPVLGASVLALALLTGCASGPTSPKPEPTETDATSASCNVPLKNERVSLTVSTLIEGFAPIVMAMQSGAFEAAGIDFTLEKISASDSLPQIAQGRLDGQLTSYSVGNMNAVANGIEMKWVAPFYELPPTSVTEELPGYWASTKFAGTGAKPDLTSLKGQTVASPTGGSGAGGWLLAKALEKQGLKFSDVKFTTAAGADALIALENGAVAAAWLSAPHNQKAHKNPNLRLAATYEPGLNGSGIIVGPSLLDRPEVLTKLLQVLSEMNEKYLQGDYHQNAEVVAMLAKGLDQDPAIIKAGLPLIFDQTLDMADAAAYVEGLQKFARANGGGLDYDKDLSADKLVAPEFAAAAATCLKK
jgi:ABC-type nitrate/sulfonate/bicarbonate transport system substrate-binding protein